MIFLDTNVVSEVMRPRTLRDQKVLSFLNSQSLTELFLPAIVMAEIRYGIYQLPPGRRRSEIEANFTIFLESGFSTRIAMFNANCAQAYATARVTRQQAGRPVPTEDALIGGMALAYGATLATRNIADFDGYGLSLINPWAHSSHPK